MLECYNGHRLERQLGLDYNTISTVYWLVTLCDLTNILDERNERTLAGFQIGLNEI